MRILSYTLVLFVMLQACKPAQQTSTVTQDGKYHEDLSSLRPKVEESTNPEIHAVDVPKRDPKTYVEPKFTVNAQVDEVLDSIDRINLTRKVIEGYTIQVYSGLKRDGALEAKKDMLKYLPDLESVVQYVQPNFRVKTGKYFSRLEAQKDYGAVKRYFPQAIVVPDKIPIN